MTALVRKFKKIFAKDASNNGVFGSAAALAPATSNNPETIESLPAFLAGWNDATEGGLKLPTLEDMQGLKYDTDYHLAYFYQEGIPEYNSATEYTTNSIVKETGTTKLYKSIALLNTGNPLTDAAKWTLLGDLSNLPATTLGTAAYIDTGVALGNIPLVGTQSSTTSLAGLGLLPSPITIANNVSDANNDIDFSAGTFQFDDGSGQAVATAMTKRLDAAWAAGNNQGGLFSGTKAINTWYHCWKIYNPTTGVEDSGFDTSPIAANAPAGFTKKAWRGAVLTDGSGNIIAFRQDGKTINYTTSRTQYNATSGIPTSATNITIEAPLGIRCKVTLDVLLTKSSAISSLMKDPITTQESTAVTLTSGSSVNRTSFYTNTSSQIQHYCTSSTATAYSFSIINWEIPDNLY